MAPRELARQAGGGASGCVGTAQEGCGCWYVGCRRCSHERKQGAGARPRAAEGRCDRGSSSGRPFLRRRCLDRQTRSDSQTHHAISTIYAWSEACGLSRALARDSESWQGFRERPARHVGPDRDRLPRGRGDHAVALCPRLRLQAGALPGRRGDGDRGRGVGRLIRVEKSLGSCSHRVSRTPRLGFRSRCRTGTPTHGIRQGTGHVGLQRAVSADSAGATPAGFPRASGTVCRRRAAGGREGAGP